MSEVEREGPSFTDTPNVGMERLRGREEGKEERRGGREGGRGRKEGKRKGKFSSTC